MGVPIVYRKSEERAIASFDFNDIAEGTGIIIFYGYFDADSATDPDHKMSQNKFFSRVIETSF